MNYYNVNKTKGYMITKENLKTNSSILYCRKVL